MARPAITTTKSTKDATAPPAVGRAPSSHAGGASAFTRDACPRVSLEPPREVTAGGRGGGGGMSPPRVSGERVSGGAGGGDGEGGGGCDAFCFAERCSCRVAIASR